MNFRLFMVAALFAGSSTAAAAPGDVNAQAFYVDAVSLQKKGMAALFDKRTKPMLAQMKDAGVRTRAANEVAARSGTPLYCVPAADKKSGMGSDKAIAMLGRVPEGERRALTLFEAWKRALAREYPCR